MRPAAPGQAFAFGLWGDVPYLRSGDPPESAALLADLNRAPLAFAGVPKHLVVTAYQSANGLVNLFTPAFAVVAGGLAIGRVKFDVWWRFVLPLLLLLALLCVVVLSIGAVIGQ